METTNTILTYYDQIKAMTFDEFASWFAENCNTEKIDYKFCKTLCEHKAKEGEMCKYAERTGKCAYGEKFEETVKRILKQPVEVPIEGIRTDCIMYNEKSNDCSGLRCLCCSKGKCSFYKSRAEYNADGSKK